jgi:DNA invertase Pin-like site-specific DNA recombinase
MATIEHTPAAQYLRMSTDHQQYSLENQSAAIKTYADHNGFEIVRTYEDTARSGVILKHRAALQRLLADVVGGTSDYRAILVYDVSRWGRFQDTDEPAHYEFLCKSAGIPVHYCAETFANDDSLPSLIMKALKRAMAGEYSRELGVKVLAGQKRLALLGFKMGGVPGYGLRRMLVSPSKTPKQPLASGERKSLATDRVILVPGAEAEVRCVRNIFRMFLAENRTVYGIAQELNRRGVVRPEVSKWDYLSVYHILSHPKYAGCNVFARSSAKLYTPPIRLPKSQWVVTPGSFEPIVDMDTFERTQALLAARTIAQSDNQVLDSLRSLLAKKGKLSLQLIQDSPETPSPSTYRHRFGSLRRAYQLVGYGDPDQFRPLDLRHRTMVLRDQLIDRIVRTFPHKISVFRRSGRWRSRLRTSGGTIISVLIARSIRSWKDSIRWQVEPHPREKSNVTLLARLTEDNERFLDFHVFSKIDPKRRFRASLRDPWLRSGKKLPELDQLCEFLRRMGRK